MRAQLRARTVLEETARRAMVMAPISETGASEARGGTGGDGGQGQEEESDEDTSESEVAAEGDGPAQGQEAQRGRRRRPAVKTTYTLRKKRGN
jgi:hypothetical protein